MTLAHDHVSGKKSSQEHTPPSLDHLKTLKTYKKTMENQCFAYFTVFDLICPFHSRYLVMILPRSPKPSKKQWILMFFRPPWEPHTDLKTGPREPKASHGMVTRI